MGERKATGGVMAPGSGSHSSPADIRAVLAALVGLAPYWFLLRRPGLFYSLAGHSDTALSAVGWYLAYLALVATAVLAACALGPALRARVGREGCGGRFAAPGLFGLLVLQALLKAVDVGVDLPGAAGFAVALCDTALYAVVLVCLTYLWAAWCIRETPRRAALVAIGSFTLSFFVKLVGLLPEPAATLASAALPLASGVCWLVATGGRRPADLIAHVGDGAGIGGICGPVRRVAALLVAFLIAGGIFRGVAFGMVAGEPISPQFTLRDAVSIAVALVVLVYYLVHSSMLRLPWFITPLSVAVFFAGLLLMMVFADDRPAIGGNLVVIGRTSLGLLLWITLVDAARAYGLAITRVFGVLFVLVDVVSSLFGYVIVPFVMASLGYSLGDVAAVLSSIVTFILITASVSMFGRMLGASLGAGDALAQGGRGLVEGTGWDTEGSGVARGEADARDAGAQPAVRLNARDDRCPQPPAAPYGFGWLDAASLDERGSFATETRGMSADDEGGAFADFGLTDREAEVARLLAEGNSQKKIAGLLCVSVGTVQTHVKGVYRKLGVHSRQELIDLVRGV